jgi:hypothetical protein
MNNKARKRKSGVSRLLRGVSMYIESSGMPSLIKCYLIKGVQEIGDKY